VDTFTVALIAFGLAMDSFAVSMASGLSEENLRIYDALKVAVFFWFFSSRYAGDWLVSRD